MKNKKGKKVSTEELAIMIAEGFEGVDKKFESADQKFDSMDKKFDSIDKKFEVLESKLSQKIDGLGNRIDHLVGSKVSWDAHKRLEDRVVRLEDTVGVKK